MLFVVGVGCSYGYGYGYGYGTMVIDVSGKRYVDHEAQVRGWFLLD